MNIIKNPSDEQIKALCAESKHLAAKWIKPAGDVTYYWPMCDRFHADVARELGFTEYSKGIAIID